MHGNKERVTVTLSPEVLRRIDAACEQRSEARSSMVERLLLRGLEGEEEFLRDMENPIFRGIARALASSPMIVKAIADVAGRKMSSEDAERVQRELPRQATRGEERQRSRKQRGKG